MRPLAQRERQGGDGTDPDLAGLLSSAAGGDEAAWRRVIELYGRRVYALVKTRCKRADLAEEVTQAVFVTVATKLRAGAPGTEDAGGGYSEQGRFESWLFRIAMNRARDEMRRVRRHATPSDPAAFARLPASHDEPPADRPESLEALRVAIEQLPESDREVIHLRHHGQLSFKQMAELLDEPLGTLLARHHRALRKLKDLLTAAHAARSAETQP
jgi:RNA polymerase sigma-70 factor (ECF subfamily)